MITHVSQLVKTFTLVDEHLVGVLAKELTTNYIELTNLGYHTNFPGSILFPCR